MPRIALLGGQPNLSSEGLLSRSHSEYVEGHTLLDMIKEDLIAEWIAIDSLGEMIVGVGNDPTTRRLLEEILANEEEHAEDLASLLKE